MNGMLPDIIIPKDNPIIAAALELARVFYAADSLTERTMLFCVDIKDHPDIIHPQADIVVSVAIRNKFTGRNGLVYAGMVE